MKPTQNPDSNRASLSSSPQQYGYVYGESQGPSYENYNVLEQFNPLSQTNPMLTSYTQQPYYQQSQLTPKQQQQMMMHAQKQEALKKKKSLNVKSQTFQKPGVPGDRPGSQNTVEPAFTYDSATDVTLSSIDTEPNPGVTSLQINSLNTYPIEHLELSNFKLKPCSHNTQHNHKQCPFYHNLKDRKRPGNFYSADLCEFSENPENCRDGDLCIKAHNRVEQLYKSEKYKTKFCSHYPHSLQLCEYGTFCSFAHNEHDITIDLIHNFEYDDDFYMFHFKTIWCPFNLTQHDKALCVYAHNWQDYRRKPNVYSYDPLPCPNWKSTDFIVNYEDGCPLKEKCSKCHGWKELEYHPFNYKTKHCPSKNCQKGKDCPHYHHMKERRAITTTISNGIFKLMPRNRIVTGTFKKRKEDISSFKHQRGLSAGETNTSLDAGLSLPISMESLNELPPQEQLKWMTNMIQTMMAKHSINEPAREDPELISKQSHRRTNSDESLYLPQNPRSTKESATNPHVLNLFGSPEDYSHQQEHQMMSEADFPMQNMLFRTLLSSPQKKFTSHSVQNPDDPRAQYPVSLMRPAEEHSEGDLRFKMD